jgi:RNA polymerase sigma factor (sigma-70 family)
VGVIWTLTTGDQTLQSTPDDQRDADLQLAARALAGSDAAWDAIFNTHYLPIWHLSYALTLDRLLAEDLLGETFLKVKENLKQYRGQCALIGWIRTICRNQHRDDVKYQSLRGGNYSIDAIAESDEFVLDAARWTGREDPTDGWVTHLDLKGALSRIGEDEREAYLLMKCAGYTSEEAGKLVGVAATTMRSRASRAREQLCNLLPAYGEGGA